MRSSLALSCLLALWLLCGLCTAMYGPRDDVVILTKENFANEVLASPHVWLVEFYAPWCGHCVKLAPAMKKVATNLKGIVKVGVIDADSERELGGIFGIKGFPTIKLFPSEQSPNPHQKGLPWKQPVDYNGARSAGAMVRFATSNLPNLVTVLNAKNQESFLAGEEAKALLFTDKSKVPTLYKAMAVEFKDRLDCGLVKKSNKELVDKFSITSFPSVIVVKPDGSKEEFSGKIKAEALQKFLSGWAKPPIEYTKGAPGAKAEKAAPPDTSIKQVTTQDELDQWCLSKRGLCLLMFLDPLDSATRFQKHKDILQQVINKHVKHFNIMWLNGPEQYALYEHFDLGGGFPNIAVYSPGKKRVIRYVGAFNEETITDFLGRVLRGKVSSYEVGELPGVAKPPPPPPEDDDDE